MGPATAAESIEDMSRGLDWGSLPTNRISYSEWKTMRNREKAPRARKPKGVSSKAANWGHFKTGQRKWLGTVKSCTRS